MDNAKGSKMTLDECIESYEETGNTLFYTYVEDEKIIAEVKWGAAGADYICYKDYFGARIEVVEPAGDMWCEF
jgi:hypothetical protein